MLMLIINIHIGNILDIDENAQADDGILISNR